jgi:hypothetical protein
MVVFNFGRLMSSRFNELAVEIFKQVFDGYDTSYGSYINTMEDIERYAFASTNLKFLIFRELYGFSNRIPNAVEDVVFSVTEVEKSRWYEPIRGNVRLALRDIRI